MVAEDDGLPTWKNAGKWTEDKLYFWYRYLDITTTAMGEKLAWPGGSRMSIYLRGPVYAP